MTKKEDTPTQLPKAVRSTLADAQEVSSDTTIAQTSVESKENNAAVQKNVRYQLAEQDELAKLRTEQQQLTKQRSALKEERSAWLNSAEVQQIEAKKKALGVFSAEGKAYRESEEYQGPCQTQGVQQPTGRAGRAGQCPDGADESSQ